jgi:hypothetical protein
LAPPATRRNGSKGTGAKAACTRDTLVRLIIDVPDTVANRRWLKQFKEQWKQRLEQVEVWMISYAITVE